MERTSERAMAPSKYQFILPIFAMDCLRERILKEWNISAMERVKNAIVIPFLCNRGAVMSFIANTSLSGMAEPFAIIIPKAYATRVSTVTITPW